MEQMADDKRDRDMFNALYEAMEYHFNPEDIIDIDSNCGTIFIDLKNGETYSITILKSEEK